MVPAPASPPRPSTSLALTVLLGLLIALTPLGTDTWAPALPVLGDSLGATVGAAQLTVTTMHPAKLARAFAEILSDPRFAAPFAAMLCAQAGIFAFVSNSAFVLMKGAHLAPVAYSLIFAAVMLGQISGAWASRRLVLRAGIARLLRTGAVLDHERQQALLGILFDGSARPMASAAALGGAGAFLIERFLLRGKA